MRERRVRCARTVTNRVGSAAPVVLTPPTDRAYPRHAPARIRTCDATSLMHTARTADDTSDGGVGSNLQNLRAEMIASSRTSRRRRGSLLLRTPGVRANVGSFARVLSRGYDPRPAFGRYQHALREAAQARQNALGDVSSSSLAFALETLLPLRGRGLARHVSPRAVNPQALEAFLAHSLEIAFDAIEHSDDAESLTDATTAALDDVHSYVVAHGLVSDNYLTAERAFVDRLLAARRDLAHAQEHDRLPATTATEVSVGSPTNAANDNLALAA